MFSRRAQALLAAAALGTSALPAMARTSVPTPVIAKNTELVMQLPEAAGAVAMKFSVDKPLMVLSTLKGIHTYDITDPANPTRLGFLPMVIEQNEGMSLVERPDGKKYALIGSNGAVAGLRGTTPDTDTASRKLFVVDVTVPQAPGLLSSVVTPTRTHTVSCATLACEYAYSDGRAGEAISIIDLRDIANPKIAGTYKSVVPGGHDQDVDGTGVLWHAGVQGSVALDVSVPDKPVQLNSTNAQGVGNNDYTGKPYNNFIHHNSFRPNADKFVDEVVNPDGTVTVVDSGEPSLDKGNVYLVTEEDYLQASANATKCGDYEGSFQTWHIPWLDAKKYNSVNPQKLAGKGTMTPLDRWNTELLDTGMTTPAGAFCSAHYFDYRDGGFVAQGWYQQGTRILDVRNPKDIKQVGYFFTGATETWGAYWVPAKWAKGQTLVYTADATRGVEILKVTLPATPPAETTSLTAPILKSWLTPNASLASRASQDWGTACPLPVAGI